MYSPEMHEMFLFKPLPANPALRLHRYSCTYSYLLLLSALDVCYFYDYECD